MALLSPATMNSSGWRLKPAITSVFASSFPRNTCTSPNDMVLAGLVSDTRDNLEVVDVDERQASKSKSRHKYGRFPTGSSCHSDG